MLDHHELWSYRELAVALMVRDIKVRYRQTMIGLAWAVLKPVLTMIVFTIVFSHVVNLRFARATRNDHRQYPMHNPPFALRAAGLGKQYQLG